MLTAGLTACGAGEPSRGWTGTVDTLSNGAVVVRNPERGVWDSASAWRIEEAFRLGTAAGEGPEPFGRVNDLAVDGYGRVWVLEAQARELRVFDAAGEHVRTIGRDGAGPGEFGQPLGMDWGAGAELWIYDPGNARFSVFDTAGQFVTSHRRPLTGSHYPWRGGFDAEGRLYDLGSVQGGSFGAVFVGFDVGPDGGLLAVDTVPVPDAAPGQYFELRNESGRIRVTVRFAPSLRYSLDRRGYLWFGMTAPYRLYQRTLAGDTVRIVDRAYTPVPVTSEEIDEAVEGLDWFVRQGGEIDRSRFPDVKPAFRRFFLDDTGHLWVEPVTAAADDRGRVFDVFDPDGRYLGRIRSRFTMRRPVFHEGYLYAVTADELDVPYVVRARVVRAGADSDPARQP